MSIAIQGPLNTVEKKMLPFAVVTSDCGIYVKSRSHEKRADHMGWDFPI